MYYPNEIILDTYLILHYLQKAPIYHSVLCFSNMFRYIKQYFNCTMLLQFTNINKESNTIKRIKYLTLLIFLCVLLYGNFLKLESFMQIFGTIYYVKMLITIYYIYFAVMLNINVLLNIKKRDNLKQIYNNIETLEKTFKKLNYSFNKKWLINNIVVQLSLKSIFLLSIVYNTFHVTHYWNRDRLYLLTLGYEMYVRTFTEHYFIINIYIVTEYMQGLCYSLSGNLKDNLSILKNIHQTICICFKTIINMIKFQILIILVHYVVTIILFAFGVFCTITYKIDLPESGLFIILESIIKILLIIHPSVKWNSKVSYTI